MSTFIPNTIFRVCKGIPWDNSYKDTILFDSLWHQTTYIYSKLKYDFSDFTYQIPTDSVLVPVEADLLYDCNYVMFANNNWGQKWFYGFIKSIEYVSPKATRIKYEIDVIQTWMFDYTIMPSFVEREHVNGDGIGWNLVPENLEFGDSIVDYTEFKDLGALKIVIAYVTEDMNTSGGELLDGVFTGVHYRDFTTSSTDIDTINGILNEVASAGQLNAIVAIFMVPEQVIVNSDPIVYTEQATTVDGYSPKNKKVLTFPYCYLAVNNCSGNEAIYKYEYFTDPSNIMFVLETSYNLAATALLRPESYKGWNHNWDESVVLNNFPMCSWVGNVFANWLAINKYSMIANGIFTVAGVAAMGATGGIAAPVALNGIQSIANQMMQYYEKSLAPSQIQGQTKCAVGNVKWERIGFQIKHYGITKGWAKKIDSFFSMFGYKVNSLKIPNIRGRKSWNYVKTIDITITGSLPVDHMIAVKNAFNRGITFWHGDYVGDYSKDNSIISSDNIYTLPHFVSAVTSANGWVVKATFDKDMTDPTNKHNQFTITLNNVAINIAYASIDTNDNIINLGIKDYPIKFSDEVRIAYTKGTITAKDGSYLETFTSMPVTNETIDIIPVLQSATINNV